MHIFWNRNFLKLPRIWLLFILLDETYVTIAYRYGKNVTVVAAHFVGIKQKAQDAFFWTILKLEVYLTFLHSTIQLVVVLLAKSMIYIYIPSWLYLSADPAGFILFKNKDHSKNFRVVFTSTDFNIG